MKHALGAVSALLLTALITACATGTAASKTEKGPAFADIRVWKVDREESAYPDGMLAGITTRTFDEKGNLLAEEERAGDKSLVSRKTYAADADGTVTILTLGSEGEVLGKALRTMADDRVITEIQMTPKGDIQTSEEYSYDAQGQKIRWSVKTASGTEITTDYIYDAGHLARILIHDAEGNTVKRYERIFAETSLVQIEEEYNGAGTLLSRTFYDYEGQFPVRESKKNAYDAPLSSIEYANDAEGNPVAITYYDRNGKAIELKRKNWIAFTRTIRVR